MTPKARRAGSRITDCGGPETLVPSSTTTVERRVSASKHATATPSLVIAVPLGVRNEHRAISAEVVGELVAERDTGAQVEANHAPSEVGGGIGEPAVFHRRGAIDAQAINQSVVKRGECRSPSIGIDLNSLEGPLLRDRAPVWILRAIWTRAKDHQIGTMRGVVQRCNLEGMSRFAGAPHDLSSVASAGEESDAWPAFRVE